MPQSLSKLYVHLTFSTKHREPLLLAPLRAQMHAYLATVLNNQDSPTVKVGGTSDHVHALFRLSKNRSLAAISEPRESSAPKALVISVTEPVSKYRVAKINLDAIAILR